MERLIRAVAAVIASQSYEDCEDFWEFCGQLEDYISKGMEVEGEVVDLREVLNEGKT